MTRCDGGTVPLRSSESLRYLAFVVMIISWASQTIGGQTASSSSKSKVSSSVPRTADGQPDLQGVWDYGTETPLQRPDELADKEHLTPDEAARYDQQMAARKKERETGKPTRYSGEVFDDRLAKADWTKRTSLISDQPDGKMPPLTPQAEKRRDERAAAFSKAEGPEDLGLADRCILGWHSGPPIVPGNQSNVVQFIQSRDYVVIYSELNNDARFVPLNNAPPPGSTLREYSGISRGRWEKDTLVVETTNFKSAGVANLAFRQSAGTDENMHLIERLTRTDAKTLLYEFTITDPTTWIRPWSAAVTMHKTDERIYEYACHEGNHSLENMLSNARAAEKKVR